MIIPGNRSKRETVRIRGNENENNIRRWLLQELEKCTPYLCNEKIAVLNDEDLIAGMGGERGAREAHATQ
jgi:hypothetical protein